MYGAVGPGRGSRGGTGADIYITYRSTDRGALLPRVLIAMYSLDSRSSLKPGLNE